MFESLGVDPALEAVYLMMLKKPDADVPALAAHLAMDEPAVRSAMDGLARLALLRPSLDTPDALRPVTPAVGLESLLARQQAELLKRQRGLEDSRAALAVLVADYVSRQPDQRSGWIEEVSGLDATRDYLERLTHGTRFEVYSMMPDASQTPENLEASKPLDTLLLERGVDIRSLYLDSVRNDPPTAAYAHWMHERGGQVRTAMVLPVRMILVDREIAVVPLDPARTSLGIAVIRSAGALSVMYTLWDQIWDSAAPLGDRRATDDLGLTDAERELLRLLSQGDTDEAVARKLGVSSRTVGRIVAELSERLGARSRFQAGVRATERGWLTRRPRPTAGEPTDGAPAAEAPLG